MNLGNQNLGKMEANLYLRMKWEYTWHVSIKNSGQDL